MGEAFFTDVPGPIRFGGLDSTDPLDVQGLAARPDGPRQARWTTTSGPASASGTRSPGPASTCSASGRSTGRGSDPAPTRWPPRARRWRSRSSSSTKLGAPYYCFHDRDVAPETGDASPSSAPTSTRSSTTPPATRSGPACACCGARPTCSRHPRYPAGAATNPDPEVFAYAAAQVKHMLEVTQRLGGENYVLWGGREGYDTLLNTDLATRGRPARPLPAPGRRAQAQDRLQGPAADRAQADGADEAPVRLRRRDGARLPGPQRPRGRVPAQHRGQPRDARRAQLPPRGRATRSPTGCSAASTPTAATRRTAGTPTSSRTRSRTSSLPLYEILRAGGIAHRRLQLRRQAAPPEHRPDGPVPRAHRRHRHARAGPARRGGPDRARRAGRRSRTGATPAGTASSARRSSAARCPSPTSRPGSRTARIDPGRVVGQPGAPREPRQPGDLGGRPAPAGLTAWASSSGSTSRRRRPRRSSSTRPARCRRSASSAYGFEPAAPAVERAGPAPVVDRRDRGHPGGRWRPRASARRDVEGVGLTGQMHGLVLLDADGEVLRPAILWNDQRTAAECDAIRETVGPARLDRDHRQRRPDRVHGAQARLGPRPRARGLAPGRPRPAAQGLRPPPADRRLRPRQGRRRRHASCSTSRRATGRR